MLCNLDSASLDKIWNEAIVIQDPNCVGGHLYSGADLHLLR